MGSRCRRGERGGRLAQARRGPDCCDCEATAAAREVYSAVKGSAQYDLDYAGVARFWKARFNAP